MVRHIYLLLLVSVTALGFSPSAWAREEEGFGVGWLWIPVIIGLVWFMNHMYERHRSSELRNVARHMGFQFLGNTPSSILRSNFKLAKEKGKIGNLLRGVRDNVEIEVFSYEVSAGENTTTTTIVAFRSASLELPRFELYPKGTLARSRLLLRRRTSTLRSSRRFQANLFLKAIKTASEQSLRRRSWIFCLHDQR